MTDGNHPGAPAPEPEPDLVIVGRIRRAHGLGGAVLVETLTGAPDLVFAPGQRLWGGTAQGDIGPRPASLHVATVEPFPRGLRVRFREIEGRTEAESWRDRYLLLPRSEVPEAGPDEVVLDDLVGLHAACSDGTSIGVVVGYYELRQGIVLEVERAGGEPAGPAGGGDARGRRETVLIPYHEQFVRSVDLAERRIVVDPPAGLLD
jgi:16S rRNA processing protein RimM